ncbi:MAG: hypothetical protein R2728_12610 [Chitinophagales bacterium]
MLWSTGESTQQITVSPTETTDYFATIFDNNGSDIDTVTDFVNNCSDPCDGLVADAGPDVTICLGDSTVLTGNIFSGNDYNICLWSTGDTTQEITVSPTETTDYFATIFDNNGCSDIDTVTVFVNNCSDPCDGVVADAGPDVAICLGDSTVLTGNIFSGNDYNICLWSTGDTTQEITVSPTETTDYFATIFDNNGCSDIDTVTVFVEDCSDTLQCADSTQCVFPGDGNKNFSVNNYDLLDIGYSYGTTGPVRENASIVAEFQEAVDWNQFGIEGIDLKHADCNGDGIISNLDVEAIEANYMLLEGDGERIVDINDGVSIELVFSSDTLAVDTLINDSSYLEIEAEIVVNNLDPATPIYGLAFQINFSDENLELNNAYANWEENSWLTSNNEFIFIQKFIPEFNRLDVAISRTDGLAAFEKA